MDEILWCDHSNETSSAVLLHGTVYFLMVCKMYFVSLFVFVKYFVSLFFLIFDTVGTRVNPFGV